MNLPTLQRFGPRVAWLSRVIAVATMIFGSFEVGLRADEFHQFIWPLLEKHCLECHRDSKHKGEVNLQSFQSAERFDEAPELLETLSWVLEDGEMPPRKSLQPSEEERQRLFTWFMDRLTALQEANADDPGHAVMARLNQAEYDHVVRDLTGFDLNPARFFTADQAGKTGFTNVGAVLDVQPVRIENYLGAARWVMDHAFVSPNRGIVWHRDLPNVDTPESARGHVLEELAQWHVQWERQVFAGSGFESALADETERASGDPGAAASNLSEVKVAVANLDGYLLAAWKYEHREALGRSGLDFASLGAEIEGSYVPVVAEAWWRLLKRESQVNYMIENFARLWREVPGPGEIGEAEARRRFEAMEALYVQIVRPERWFEARGIKPHRRVNYAIGKPAYEVSEAYEPVRGKLEFYLERGFPEWAVDLRERGRYRSEIDLGAFGSRRMWIVVTDAWDGSAGDEVSLIDAAWDGKAVELPEATVRAPAVISLDIPDGAKRFTVTAQLSEANRRKASVQVLVMNREPEGLDTRFLPGRQVIAWPENRNGRNTRMAHESALLGQVTTRSDLMASRRGRFAAWLLDGADLTGEERRNLTQFRGWGEASPYFLDSLALEALVPEEAVKLRRQLLGDLVAYVRHDAAAMRSVFDERARQILDEMLPRIWRRPLTEAQREHYFTFYEASMANGAGFHESVKRPLIVAMVSPQFLFKAYHSEQRPDPHPLNGFELANRLSFFLWASMPDDRLFALAEEGRLTDPAVLVAEARRMLQDLRAEALGTEMAGKWLGFYDFDDFTQPDMDKFPEYTESLRRAMYEESIHFFVHLLQENRPMHELIDADYTFVNEELANHYGIPGVCGEVVRKVSIPAELATQRGGLFGMGSLLTVKSTPLRSSPIYRGVWVVGSVLGTPTPEPSIPVEPLSPEERSLEGLPIHEQLKVHRANPDCAVCHDRIDPPGLALEYFDAIGRWRESDDAGQPVFATGVLRNGRTVDGLPGLRDWVKGEMDLVKRQFARKTASYALGRYLTVSDRQLVADMVAAMEADQGRPWAALETLIRSKQFRYRRDAREGEGIESAGAGGDEEGQKETNS